MIEDSSGGPASYSPPGLGPFTPQTASPPEAPVGLPQLEPQPQPQPQNQPQRRRLNWLWWTSGSLIVASLAALCVYLVVVSNQWSNRVDDLTSVSQDLGSQLSEETTARLQSEAKAASLQSQLDTATARITVLADEEANATDHETVWINLVDSFIDCANGRQELIEVLNNPRLYFPGKSNTRVEQDLVEYCDGLASDYVDFKTEIGK